MKQIFEVKEILMLKYIIFGAGGSGESALDFLGYERVFCFVDNNKFGTKLYDKEVRSFDDLLAMDRERCIIVIASEKYFWEMEQQLLMADLKNYFIFREKDRWEIGKYLPGYMIYRKWESVSLARVLVQYDLRKYKKIVVLGVNRFLPYLLAEIGIQGELSNILGIVSLTECKWNEVWGIPFVELEEVWDKTDLLIVNIKRNESEIIEYIENHQKNFDILDIYDVDRFEPVFQHPELEKYHNIHKGKRIWLIGNGPSMKIEDLEVLYRHGEICFGFNKIYKIYDKTRWRADYLGMTDRRIIEYCMDVTDTVDSPIFVGDEYHRSTDVHQEKVEYFHVNHEEYFPNMPRFSENIVTQIYWGCAVAFDIGLQFAYYMGASEIYLLGMDNSSTGKITDACNHFIPDYFSDEEKVLHKERAGEWNIIDKAYEKAEIYSRQHSFRIYNATRGGKLEVFERVDFDRLFK